jgi:hypothetical protein
MTTRIFIENATMCRWVLVNQDGKKEYVINPNAIYSLKINYSPTFDRTYTFVAENYPSTILITINTNGEIKDLSVYGTIGATLKNAEHHTLYNMLAPHCQHYEYQPDPLVISPYRCTVSGHCQNKILITPINDANARVIPPTVPSILDHQEVYTHTRCPISAFLPN